MTFPGGDPGQNPRDRSGDTPPGAYEAPPIEQSAAGDHHLPPPPPPAPGWGAAPPPGYASPGYGPPYGGYPPPGYHPGYPQPGYLPAPAGTNTLAIAALVASGIGVFCGIGSIAGIVLGVIALNQITQSGQNGRGLALAGVVVGAVSLVISVAWTVLVLAS